LRSLLYHHPARPWLAPLSLHAALPISHFGDKAGLVRALAGRVAEQVNREVTSALARSGEPREVLSSTLAAFCAFIERRGQDLARSEEHTSELQSRENLVCRLPLGKTTL